MSTRGAGNKGALRSSRSVALTLPDLYERLCLCSINELFAEFALMENVSNAFESKHVFVEFSLFIRNGSYVRTIQIYVYHGILL